MLNPFTFLPAFFKVLGVYKQYNKKHLPEIAAARDAGDYETERALIMRETGVWATEVSKRLKISYVIEGEENIPESGPIMVYANHQSLLDIVSVFYLFRNHFQMGFIAKEEWRKLKPLAEAIEYTRSLFLIRDNPREALKVVGQCAELLKEGFSITIFPEGTRSRGHEMGNFQMASFKFAEKAGVPILPVTLDGGYHVLEEYDSFKPNQTIRVRVHPLVHIEKMDKAERKQAFEDVVESIRKGLDEGE